MSNESKKVDDVGARRGSQFNKQIYMLKCLQIFLRYATLKNML